MDSQVLYCGRKQLLVNTIWPEARSRRRPSARAVAHNIIIVQRVKRTLNNDRGHRSYRGALSIYIIQNENIIYFSRNHAIYYYKIYASSGRTIVLPNGRGSRGRAQPQLPPRRTLRAESVKNNDKKRYTYLFTPYFPFPLSSAARNRCLIPAETVEIRRFMHVYTNILFR